MRTTTPQTGKVYLIGAGPGDPELLTLRGLRYLMRADVVFYDRLLDTRLLNYAPPGARLVAVGKRQGQAHSQEWIQRLMIAEAQKGYQVVRLKGGDPFVFGRGGEEVEALIRAGVAYEVVPGVSSAIAVPALAGIPVLHRRYASTLAIVSGHRCQPEEMSLWATWLAQAGTLVILMGMANLARIMTGLQQAGVSPALPVAVVRDGLAGQEQTVLGTIADIADAASYVGSPAVIVLGRVVAWKQQCEDAALLQEAATGPCATACGEPSPGVQVASLRTALAWEESEV
jgi:uroporphyrin-III C-methyltransferase